VTNKQFTNVLLVDCILATKISWKSTILSPKHTGEKMDTITGNFYTLTVTTERRPKKIEPGGSEVPMTKANLLRSGVLRKAHAPFWSSAREGDLPGNCNWVQVPPDQSLANRSVANPAGQAGNGSPRPGGARVQAA